MSMPPSRTSRLVAPKMNSRPAKRKNARVLGRSAPQKRSHARQELRKGKEPPEVVIRAEIEPIRTVPNHTTSRQEQDRSPRDTPASQIRRHAPAVAPWQLHIKPDQLVRLCFRQVTAVFTAICEIVEQVILLQLMPEIPAVFRSSAPDPASCVSGSQPNAATSRLPRTGSFGRSQFPNPEWVRGSGRRNSNFRHR